MNVTKNSFYFLATATIIALVIFAISLAFTLLVIPIILLPKITQTLGWFTLPATAAYYILYYSLYKVILNKTSKPFQK